GHRLPEQRGKREWGSWDQTRPLVAERGNRGVRNREGALAAGSEEKPGGRRIGKHRGTDRRGDREEKLKGRREKTC
ncbi:hypothetical protein chiPu_0027157, partial [Chiloscyllium punctatum]|nr:hypothetical protein [Chiloscyllium punctatum]